MSGGGDLLVGPTPPATYDGTIDMTDYDPGHYKYKYVVQSLEGCQDLSYVDIYIYDAPARLNDDCNKATTIPYSAITGIGGITDQDNLDNCPGYAAPTDSGEDEPEAWGAVSDYSGDLWYKWSSPNLPTDVQVQVTINSSAYGSQAMTTPMVAIYSAITNCDALTEEDSSVGSGNIATVQLDAPAGAAFPIYLRVASPTGEEGKFDIIITTNS